MHDIVFVSKKNFETTFYLEGGGPDDMGTTCTWTKKRLCMIKSYNKRNATYQEIGQPNIYFYPAVPALSIEIILIRTSWTTWWLRRCDSMKLEEKNSIWSVIDKTSGTLVKRIEDNTYQQMLKRRTETIYSNTKAKGIWERMSRLRVLSNQ